MAVSDVFGVKEHLFPPPALIYLVGTAQVQHNKQRSIKQKHISHSTLKEIMMGTSKHREVAIVCGVH